MEQQLPIMLLLKIERKHQGSFPIVVLLLNGDYTSVLLFSFMVQCHFCGLAF